MSIDNEITDLNWLTNSFMVDLGKVSQPHLLKKVVNSARFKGTDTTPGGNIAHNAPPQWCRNSDIKEKGFGDSKGMGRGYSKIIDDTGSLIHMRPGITAFNSMTQFFLKGLSPEVAYMQKTGEAPGIAHNLASILGQITTIPLIPFSWFGQALRFAAGKPQTKYAYLRYTPPLYFSAASNIYNTLNAYSGVSNFGETKVSGSSIVAEPVNPETAAGLHRLLPDIIGEDGVVDLFAVAQRAKRITAARSEYIEQQLSAATDRDSFYKALLGVDDEGNAVPPPKLTGAFQNLNEMLDEYRSGLGAVQKEADIDGKKVETKPAGWFDEAQVAFMSRVRQGMDWISFRYEGEKTVDYSFNNSVGESQLQSKLNGVVSTANNAVFSMAGGNIGEGVVASTLEAGMSLIKDSVNGFLAGLGAGGLLSVGGAAFTDIPQQWQESSADIPGFNLSLTLNTWCGHPMVISKRIHLPLSLLLPFMLPRSTGMSTYTSPFAMEYFAQGHSQSRYAMVTSGSIQLGDDQGGWTVSHLARKITVNMQIKDLSSVMHMPVGGDFDVGDAIESMWADDTALSNFLGAVGGLTWDSQVNGAGRAKMLNLRKHLALQRAEDWVDPNRIGMAVASSIPGRAATAAYNVWNLGESL